jgi:acyl-CoA synthetase (AMP-forming)/AMP-acid ligase II
MRSTMQEVPLLISQVLEYGTTVYRGSEVVTWGAEGPRRTSYPDLGADCRRLANALRGLGIDADQRVGTFMWNNEEHLELYLTVPSMGAVLHTINIRLFPAQMIYVITHADDKVIVVDNSLAEPFSKLLPQLPSVQHVIVNGPVPDAVRATLTADGTRQVHDYRTLLDAGSDRFDWPQFDENDAAAICYTSGTTGNPKGVVYSHRSNVLHAGYVAGNAVLGLSEASRVLAVVPLFHANAWGLPYAALHSGADLIMPDRFLQAEPLAAIIEQEKVTVAAAVPTIWNDVLLHLDAHPELDVGSLQRVMVGGSACTPALMRGFEDRHGITVVQGWGMTETSPVGSVAVPPALAEGDEYWAARYSQGRLAPQLQTRLIGADGSEQPWDGESDGEVQVRGPWVTASYYLDEEDADDKFEDGWLKTGDIGRLSADGFLTLTDRAKDVIKSGGEWISSVELENQLMGHPAVREASVVGVPDDRWGERPLATVVLLAGRSATVEELSDYLCSQVARWQVPERWAFVTEIPKTSVGKFDKKVIRARYAEGELDVVRPVRAAAD